MEEERTKSYVRDVTKTAELLNLAQARNDKSLKKIRKAFEDGEFVIPGLSGFLFRRFLEDRKQEEAISKDLKEKVETLSKHVLGKAGDD